MPYSLHIENLSKRFYSQRIFKSVQLNINFFEKIAILGTNGSGKSTLLKIMSGFQYADSGIINWMENGNAKEVPNFTFSAPYLELFEHLTVFEMLKFQIEQKKAYKNFEINEILELGNFANLQHKLIKELSSGIKQRLKNTLAIFTQSDVLFLDEPCSNLDKENIVLFQNMVTNNTEDRMVIIASNSEDEYKFICKKEFRIENCNLLLAKSN